MGANSSTMLAERLRFAQQAAEAGCAPARIAPAKGDLRAPERLAIDYGNAAELADKSAKARKALATNQPMLWKALRAQGIFRSGGPAPKVAFLYPGQGSQYPNMLRTLCTAEPIVASTFAEADRVMAPFLGKPLSEFIFVDETDSNALARAEKHFLQTAITQPAVLAADVALTRLLAAYGIRPDFTIGHSLGEYGALVAADALPFADALELVSLQSPELRGIVIDQPGKMVAVFAPLEEVRRLLNEASGYVVLANVNSNHQAVIGGETAAVQRATDRFLQAGYDAVPLPVTEAFHTSLVAAIGQPLRNTLQRMRLKPPRVPTVANLDGQFYPKSSDAVPRVLDMLQRHVASPVEFVKGLHTLYDAGARVFVEVGPKKALQGFADDVLGDRPDVWSLFTNHPKIGDVVSFNHALCGLYATGLGYARFEAEETEGPQCQCPTTVSSPERTLERSAVATLRR